MNNAVLLERRVLMRRAVIAGLDGTALVDCNVDNDGALLHGLDHFLGDEDRGTSARDENRTDEEVCLFDPLRNVVGRGILGDAGGDEGKESLCL